MFVTIPELERAHAVNSSATRLSKESKAHSHHESMVNDRESLHPPV